MFTDLRQTHRVIGRFHGVHPGPCVIVVAGLHGNEPTGIDAAERVFSVLEQQDHPFRGDLHAFRGNLCALSQEKRYIDKDLNRIWEPGAVRALRHGTTVGELQAEDREQLALWAVIEEAIREARGEVLLVDLHTSSAASRPFIVMGHDAAPCGNGWQVPVPVIVDRPGLLRGMLVNFIRERGHAALAFEAGQHGTDESIEIHAAAIWRFLSASGAVAYKDLPASATDHAILPAPTDEPPQRLEMTYRHAVEAGDAFEMLPGFRNFDSVVAGQLLARDRSGEIHAPESGRLFLPLYQPVGEDGFFLVRDLPAEPAVGLEG